MSKAKQGGGAVGGKRETNFSLMSGLHRMHLARTLNSWRK